MPRINVRLDDVQSNFVIVPPATYVVQIQERSKVKKSKNSDGAYIFWVVKIVDGELEGKTFSFMTSLNEDALWNLKSLLEIIDVVWEDDGFELELAFDKVLAVETDIQDFEGTPRIRVNKYLKA